MFALGNTFPHKVWHACSLRLCFSGQTLAPPLYLQRGPCCHVLFPNLALFSLKHGSLPDPGTSILLSVFVTNTMLPRIRTCPVPRLVLGTLGRALWNEWSGPACCAGWLPSLPPPPRAVPWLPSFLDTGTLRVRVWAVMILGRSL